MRDTHTRRSAGRGLRMRRSRRSGGRGHLFTFLECTPIAHLLPRLPSRACVRCAPVWSRRRVHRTQQAALTSPLVHMRRPSLPLWSSLPPCLAARRAATCCAWRRHASAPASPSAARHAHALPLARTHVLLHARHPPWQRPCAPRSVLSPARLSLSHTHTLCAGGHGVGVRRAQLGGARAAARRGRRRGRRHIPRLPPRCATTHTRARTYTYTRRACVRAFVR
jgi:hypothetical protein